MLSLWSHLLPGCGLPMSGGSSGEQCSTQSCYEQEFGLADLQRPKCLVTSQLQCLPVTRLVILAWNSQYFCLSLVGERDSCLSRAAPSVRRWWLWQWRKPKVGQVYHWAAGGICMAMFFMKVLRLFSADGVPLTVSAFSIPKSILTLLQLVWQLLLLFCQAAPVCHLSTSAASV